ncbi:MAG TPA: hypothetical protein VLN45_06975, partial [Ignavibacteriaceae bacterium]|nr:hypothetical protein [Ignavibacteriaceae bacterium]
YTAFRKYIVPGNILNKNKNNVVSIRVFDSQLSGGILSGEIGLFINKNEMNPDLDLTGKWKFNTGDNSEWKEKNYNDSIWLNLFVPSNWDNQGFRDYDGFAWYRKEFVLPLNLENKKLILLLGKIDDIDEAYLNGTLIGSTGTMKNIESEFQLTQEYLSLRNYYIPDTLLKKGKNIIAVRVYDGFKDGGIYLGPVGIVKQETYTKYLRNKKDSKGFFD